MRKILVILIITANLCGCKEGKPQKSSTENETHVTPPIIEETEKVENNSKEEITVEQKTSQIKDEDNILSLNFNEFKLIFPSFLAEDINYSNQKDTVNIYESLGFNLSKQKLIIEPNVEDEAFQIFIAHEQKIIVYLGEKRYQELFNWTSNTPFIELKDSSNYYYTTSEYDLTNFKEYIKPNFEKIKNEILSLKGEYIHDSLGTANSFEDLPLEMWTSRVFIKIINSNKASTKTEKIIINNSSWGC